MRTPALRLAVEDEGLVHDGESSRGRIVTAEVPVAKLAAQGLVQAGANFNYKQRWANDFNVGGLTRLYRNQIVFAGLPHGSLFTPSVATLQLGLRYSMYKNLHFTARANGLVHNFISRNENIQVQDFLSGYALTAGYNTGLGPIELSGQYSDQTGKFSAYVNLGFAF